ncbi:MAG TPA: SH3 domain-containing protein [Deltaproteobacteria bacterium]|nr:SH3 domain-containing protein [Deltaproteobacteria bacterium]HOI07349.1 SH3 domain-containing protein [Deltaproteobacteria bacterium]
MITSIRHFIGFCLFSLLVMTGCAQLQKEEAATPHISNAAPVLLPGTASEMTTPGFWIGIHPDPDRVVIPVNEIEGFNRSIRTETRMVQDITAYPATVRGAVVADMLRNSLRHLSTRKYVRQDGSLADKGFFKDIEEQMALSSIPQRVNVRLAFVTAYTPQRLLPTGTELYSNIKSIYIDRLQNSSLDIGTPLAVIHASRDGKWLYAISPLSEGWMRAEHAGFVSREEMAGYLKAEPFVVTTGTKTDLFLDDGMRQYHGYVKMGRRFPTKDAGEEDPYLITIPFRKDDGSCGFRDAYVSGRDVSLGYLEYTPRTIILQAFKLLHAPYGWGDMYGEQDCSRFIEKIFATVGIQLPRNSLQQAKVGRLIAKFNSAVSDEQRLSVLQDNSCAGISILHMNGHIMLFLGSVGGNPYAIHDMQAYFEPTPEGDRQRVVNRVVVSDLRLGEGTRTGPYLKRLVTVRALEKKSI